uniref:Uncharacterized protein n=1 Tax=Arundo donax TaxID=35708 RepID=A0A0A9SR98_ARUDO
MSIVTLDHRHDSLQEQPLLTFHNKLPQEEIDMNGADKLNTKGSLVTKHDIANNQL